MSTDTTYSTTPIWDQLVREMGDPFPPKPVTKTPVASTTKRARQRRMR